ncbi:hypothetical protein CHS0354_005832 [Potamilus streckersoni]|uniref:Ionotropic glutamate receptor L-glutamate and glycine-binding domain-containing protein n=1 Tax=Potamilus streckersoni TaxID=2493646 RepID=A0AAE0VIA6_9BIVA|nr:hypothetical protein CHS0354_005832 [Potamilus streckersoni]
MLICDNDTYLGFSTVFQSMLSASEETSEITFEGTVILGSRSLIENLNALDHGINLYGSRFIISFGSDAIVQASAITGRSYGLPVITYPTFPSSKLKPQSIYPKYQFITIPDTPLDQVQIYEDNIVDVRPSMAGLASEMYTLIGRSIVHMVHIICQKSMINDGFVETFSQIFTENGFNESKVTAIPTPGNDVELLRMALLMVRNSRSRLFVLHCMEEMFGSIMRMADVVGLLDDGYAWIITQMAFTVDKNTLYNFPPGVLAVKTYQSDNYYDILKSIVDVIQKTTEHIIVDKKGKEADDALQLILSAGNFRVLKNNNILFDEKGNRKNLKYQVLKSVTSPFNGRTWNRVGYIQDDALDLSTINWRGHTIFGTAGYERDYVTVVTKKAEPFVFISDPVESRNSCSGKIACIELYTDDPQIIAFIVGRFKDGIDKIDGYYRTFCCDGVVMEILQRISKELQFDFVVFFNSNSSYGHLVNGTWTGMVGNVVSGAADIIAGAFSMDSDTIKAISSTYSFYHSAFNMISLTSGTHTSITSFLSPFNKWEWLCIFATALITAFATAFLEWNSPFGLNRCARRRGTNYSLGSGLTMVCSIWVGNKVKIKCPKSWSSKFLQNCWACVTIFVVANYTSNLTSFMAGIYNQETYSILDSRASTSSFVPYVIPSMCHPYTDGT